MTTTTTTNMFAKLSSILVIGTILLALGRPTESMLDNDQRWMIGYWSGYSLNGGTFSIASPLLSYQQGDVLNELQQFDRSKAQVQQLIMHALPIELRGSKITETYFAGRGLPDIEGEKYRNIPAHAVSIPFYVDCWQSGLHSAGSQICTSEEANANLRLLGLQVFFFDSTSGEWLGESVHVTNPLLPVTVITQKSTGLNVHAILSSDATAFYNHGLPLLSSNNPALCENLPLGNTPLNHATTIVGGDRRIHLLLTSNATLEHCTSERGPRVVTNPPPHLTALNSKVLQVPTSTNMNEPPLTNIQFDHRPIGDGGHLTVYAASSLLYFTMTDVETNSLLAYSATAGSSLNLAWGFPSSLMKTITAVTFESGLERIIAGINRTLYMLDPFHEDPSGVTALYHLPDDLPAQAHFGRRYLNREHQILFQMIIIDRPGGAILPEARLIALDVSGVLSNASSFPLTNAPLVYHDVVDEKSPFFILPLTNGGNGLTPSNNAPTPTGFGTSHPSPSNLSYTSMSLPSFTSLLPTTITQNRCKSH